MRRISVALLAVFAVAPSLAIAGSDFDAYVDGIRKAGMSESAAGDITMVSDILAGGTVFTAQREGDSISRHYMNSLCPRPGSNPEKLRELQKQVEAKAARWSSFLKKNADLDGSGFVSSAEAATLRRRVELGFIVAQVADIRDVDALAKLTQSARSEVVADLAAYAKLYSLAVKEGLSGLPALPKEFGGR